MICIAANGQEALDAAIRFHPDIVLMDFKMPIMDGVQATSLIHQKCPSVNVVVLSTFDTDECIVDALQAGAVAYLTGKDMPLAEPVVSGMAKPRIRE